MLNKVITIWSPIPNAGGTVAAINLARILVKKKYRVLVVDYDLRFPALSLYFNLTPTKNRGLEAIIPFTSANNLSPKVLESNIENVMGIDVLPLNIDHSIQSDIQNMKHIIDVAKKDYDFTIIDTAGLIDTAATYTAVLNADNCFIVVEKNAVLLQLIGSIKDFIHEKIDPEKLHLVINKCINEVPMNPKDIINFVEIYDYKELPYLGPDFINAVNTGKIIEFLDADSKKNRKYNESFKKYFLERIEPEALNLKDRKLQKKSFFKQFTKSKE